MKTTVNISFLYRFWGWLTKPRGRQARLLQRMEILEGRLARVTRLEIQLAGIEQKLMALKHKPVELEKQLMDISRRVATLANRPVELSSQLDVAERRLNTVRQWLRVLGQDQAGPMTRTLGWKAVDYKIALPPEGTNGPSNH